MTEPKKRFKTSFSSVLIKILFEFTRFQTFSLRSTVVVANKLVAVFPCLVISFMTGYLRVNPHLPKR